MCRSVLSQNRGWLVARHSRQCHDKHSITPVPPISLAQLLLPALQEPATAQVGANLSMSNSAAEESNSEAPPAQTPGVHISWQAPAPFPSSFAPHPLL